MNVKAKNDIWQEPQADKGPQSRSQDAGRRGNQGWSGTDQSDNDDLRRPGEAELSQRPRDYAARSSSVEPRSIEAGLVLALLRLLASRGGLTTSLRSARRNVSMKKTATPETPANANDSITPRMRAI